MTMRQASNCFTKLEILQNHISRSNELIRCAILHNELKRSKMMLKQPEDKQNRGLCFQKHRCYCCQWLSSLGFSQQVLLLILLSLLYQRGLCDHQRLHLQLPSDQEKQDKKKGLITMEILKKIRKWWKTLKANILDFAPHLALQDQCVLVQVSRLED